MNIISKGFTLIELTIALMSLSAVFAILIFPIGENLKISRDSVRKSNVNMISNLIKLNKIDKNKYNYKLEKSELVNILNENLLTVPSTKSGKNYFYGYSAKKDDFFIIVCAESTDKFFVQGTINAIEAFSLVLPSIACGKAITPIQNRDIPSNKNSSAQNIDSYLIYKFP